MQTIFKIKCNDCQMISINGIATHEASCARKITVRTKLAYVRMSIGEYQHYEENYIGICEKCGAERDETEGDAENYPCDVCETNSVTGIMNLLVEERIKFT